MQPSTFHRVTFVSWAWLAGVVGALPVAGGCQCGESSSGIPGTGGSTGGVTSSSGGSTGGVTSSSGGSTGGVTSSSGGSTGGVTSSSGGPTGGVTGSSGGSGGAGGDCGMGVDFAGGNLDGWTIVSGDGTQPPAGIDDIENVTLPDGSTEERANINYLGVMVHNLTYMPVSDPPLNVNHHVTFYFRLPYLPVSDPAATTNGQTIEGGLFVWDGADVQLDYGFAFQIRVNPWMLMVDNGVVKAPVHEWQASEDLGKWGDQSVGLLPIDLDWHKGEIDLGMCDLASPTATLKIDGQPYLVSASKTQKPGFGADVTARLQLEIISIDPGPADIHALHKAQFKDWTWSWSPAGCLCP